MARVTIEDCLKTGYNKFMLVHLAAKRVVQFRKGKEPLLTTTNREIVTALREIAAGKVKMRDKTNLVEDAFAETSLVKDEIPKKSEIPDKRQDEEISKVQNSPDNEG
ncbi:MAG: DNA-directed RNA polymerase subunit omega [Desulfatiglandales bacterium]